VQSHAKAVAILSEADLSSNLSFVVNVIAVVLRLIFITAARCVAWRDIETPIVCLFLSPRNATRRRNGNTALLRHGCLIFSELVGQNSRYRIRCFCILLCCRPVGLNLPAGRQPVTESGDVAGQSGRHSAATATLLAVSSYLIATTLPVTICYVLYLGFPEGDPDMTVAERQTDPTWSRFFIYGSVRALAEELGMSHYACNFYIYVCTSSVFRRQLTRVLAARCSTNNVQTAHCDSV